MDRATAPTEPVPAAAPRPGHATEAAPLSPDAALGRLQAGNQRFVAGRATAPGRYAVQRAELVDGQAPFAVVLGCSDSRVPPEILFDQGLGDLFVVRVAGNSAADPLVLGSIEFAVAVLGSVLVVVLGHDDCGAVKAAIDVVANGATLPGQLGSFVQPIVPAVHDVRSEPADRILDAAIHHNVQRAVADLGADPLLADLVVKRQLRIVGAEYRLRSGRVELVEP